MTNTVCLDREIKAIIEKRFNQQTEDGWKVVGEIYKLLTGNTLRDLALGKV